MNLSLKPRRFNGDKRTCFFPWILKQLYTITQNKFTRLHICTVQTVHSHCRATQTERHILILVWFLPTAYHLILTNPKKAYSHRFRGDWALLQVCLHTDAHPHMLPSSHPQTPPLLPYLYILTRRVTLWDSRGLPLRLPFCFSPHAQQQRNIHFCRQICSLIPKCLSPAVCFTWVLVFLQ